MIDFVNTTGKNIGEVQNTKLARFVGKGEFSVRALRKRKPKEFEMMYLGALCVANGVSKDDIEKVCESK